MGHVHLLGGFLTLLFSAAVIGMNVYAFLQSTPWYEIGTNSQLVDLHFDFSRDGVISGDTLTEWDGDSKTRTVIYTSFAFVIISFIFAVLGLLVTGVGMLKHLHKHSRKFILVSAIITLISNVLATALFVRINNAFCDDIEDGLAVNINLKGTDFCSEFKGEDSVLYWKPVIGWIITLVAAIVSLFFTIAAASIVRHKKFGYHVIH
ncbi:hypothetical protein DFA_04684 [Cavenderia fasciculata]|uniref:Transmembrane protein n=1 Tax=Cavenderia fasciculata TaxID=261658 RepID=F4PQ91_CACFS|nr:uncharacterized protein DFA_04684 [Cavenderia fasciculata]EGG22554.1 hypothetical protein DFA_04684 [Cavenderia fasciculata]|eukprot:XP_004360405.1 hypothetical protein DFA_04684 [Cavenderia fasciculata]